MGSRAIRDEPSPVRLRRAPVTPLWGCWRPGRR
jgi:hypothetical protein